MMKRIRISRHVIVLFSATLALLASGGRVDAKDVVGGAVTTEECPNGKLVGWEGGADKDLLVSGGDCKSPLLGPRTEVGA